MKKVLGIAAVEQTDFYPFGKQTFYFEDMARSFPAAVIDIFVFSPFDWNYGQKELPGYVFRNEQWEKVLSEFPNIIYDRAFTKSKSGKQTIEAFRAFLKEKMIPVLNPLDYAELLNNKVEFHSFLVANRIPTLETMPVSFILSGGFSSSIEQKTAYYLKPISGTGGLGIFVISKAENTFIISNHTNTQTEVFTGIPALFDYILSILDIGEYFIQPRANTISFERRPVDIRVIVQNYGKGDYKVTGSGVRVGQVDSFVSNINSGGSAMPVEALAAYYKEHLEKDFFQVVSRISEMCLDCCIALDQRFGNFLEIGFDILLTPDKGPVILEGNSKPSRWIFNLLAEHAGADALQAKKYLDMRAETVRVPLIFAERNFPGNN